MSRNFLTLLDRSPSELINLIEEAIKLKKKRSKSIFTTPLRDKSIAMIFEKSSTRTRISFEVGIKELGAYPLFLSSADIQIKRGESISDTAKVLSRYVDMIMIRTSEHAKIIDLVENSTIPVINGLTDDYHPCQILADIMTIYEKLGKIKGVKVAFIGDGNNVANSWMNGAAQLGMKLSIASPKEYTVNQDIYKKAVEIAKQNGGEITLTTDPYEAVKDADIIYTDVWASMGMESEQAKRVKDFEGFIVDSKLMKSTGRETFFMHCLPAHRGEEVTAEVIDGKNSIVFDEAENRLHIQKAIMLDCFEV